MKKSKTSPGRPKVDIDWARAADLAHAGASGSGIAASFGINEKTLRNRCVTDNNCLLSEFLQQKRAAGDEMLRAKQFEVALGGDKTMLIWLGKQRLGQSEKTAVEMVSPEITHLKAQIETRAKEKGIEYAEELQNYIKHYAPPPIREKLASELVQ